MLKQTNEFLNSAHQILKQFEGENSYPLYVNYLIENSHRTYDLLIAIETLLQSTLKIKELEHPIGILLRSGLHDFIYFQYVLNKSVENQLINQESFENEVREYMNGHFNKIDTTLELDERYKNLDRFKDFGSKKEFKVLGILKEGKEFAKEKKLNYLDAAINLWEWYSKYEHYGVFTNHMYNHDENELKIKSSISLLYANIYLSLYTLSDIDSNILSSDKVKSLEEISLNSMKNNANTQ